MAPDWENVPAQLLDQVIDTLISCSTSDYHRFSSVCKTWHGIAAHNYHKYKAKYGLIPRLLISASEPNHYLLLNPVTESVDTLSIPYQMRCSGSSYGWLAFLDESNSSMFLFNPYTQAKIHLPSCIDETDPHIRDNPVRPYLLEYYYSKLILSADPTTHTEYIVALIYGGCMNLAYIRSGDQAWTVTGLSLISDIIFHKGLIYGAYHKDGIISVNPNDNTEGVVNWKVIKNPWLLDDEPNSKKVRNKLFGQFYLVESADKESLYKVIKILEHDKQSLNYDCYTVEFHISKVRINRKGEGTCYWLNSSQGLEGHSIFLGCNHSLAVLPSRYPAAKLQPDVIYFTDDFNLEFAAPGNSHKEVDMGVYHVKECQLGKPFYKPKANDLPPSI